MRVVVWFVVGMVGCYAPNPPQNQPCGNGGACPYGQRCIAEVCRAEEPASDAPAGGGDGSLDSSIDGSPVTDSDGDGTVDSIDNCPTMANGDQADEDTDGIGDVCDKCPPYADPTQPDSDGDGVGNACDPRPTTAGDSWVTFQPFNSSTLTNWTVPATWTVSNGALVTDPDVTTSGNASYMTSVTDAYVMTRVTFTAVDAAAGGAYRSGGPTSAVTPSGEYRCLLRDTTGGVINGGLSRDNTPIASQNLTGVVLNATIDLTLSDRAAALDCAGSAVDGRSFKVAFNDSVHGAGQAGVRIQHAVGRFAWVAIVRTAP